MAKSKTQFICGACGHESSRWLGKCPACGEWNSMQECAVSPQKTQAGGAQRTGASPLRLRDVPLDEQTHMQSGIGELDRVLGNGLMEGSLALVGGEPGVGKSTLMLQACQGWAAPGRSVLYVTGEESMRQVRLRAHRLGVDGDHVLLLAETDMEAVLSHVSRMDRPIVIIDSIQTMYSPQVSSAPGSMSQVRECAALALRAAKSGGASIVLVGHVTKEGALAGPRVLEHIVDTVLYFEGEGQHAFRILRAVKNRFGSTNEIGVFEMGPQGMRGVDNPSSLLIGRTDGQHMAGSAITCSMEGSRPVLCEVQALVAQSAFGQPRRMASGVDYNRMLLMIAVLERRAGLALYKQDVYINAAGGLRLNEASNDLAILCAIASAATDRPVKTGLAVVGEIGLSGEMRPVGQLERRASECAKLGFSGLVAPAASVQRLQGTPLLSCLGAEDIRQALTQALEPPVKPE